MYALIKRLFAIAIIIMLALTFDANAQSPSLDSLLVLSPTSTTADDVTAQVGGTHNTSGSPIIRTEWRRLNNDIRLDVLIDELPVLAPAMIEPWSRTENFGMLPVGTYDLEARLFWDYRSGPNSSFPDPWTFPDTYGQPLFLGANRTLVTTFTVVPEPSAVLLLLGGGVALAARRRPA
jgi:hypothetical protein